MRVFRATAIFLSLILLLAAQPAISLAQGLPSAKDLAAAPDALRTCWDKAQMARSQQDTAAERRAYDEALAAYDSMTEQGRKPLVALAAAVHLRLGELDDRQRMFKDAEVEYDRGLALHPSNRPTPLQFAVFERLEKLYLEDGNCKDALRIAMQHKAIAETSWPNARLPALVTIAFCHRVQGDLAAAKQDLEAAWKMAEGANPRLPTEAINDLQARSSQMYRSMHMDQLADETTTRAERLLSRPAPTVAPRLPPSADTRPYFVDLNTCKPEYPQAAAAKGEQGKVKISFTVGKDDKLIGARIVESSGSTVLDQATLDGLALCKFKAGIINGEPIEGTFTAIYVWQLPG